MKMAGMGKEKTGIHSEAELKQAPVTLATVQLENIFSETSFKGEYVLFLVLMWRHVTT